MLNTTVNKFVVATLGLAVILVNTWFNQDWVLSEELINSIAGPLTAALVWLIPNKEKPAA